MDEKNILKYLIVCLSCLLLLLSVNIVDTVRINKLGRLCNQYRERIVAAEATNQQLGTTIEQCQSVCGELTESVNRNISTAREAVEIIGELRDEVSRLENCLNSECDWQSDYYSNLDKELEEVMNK